jgi:hypothetical protein
MVTLDLKLVTKQLIAAGWHKGGPETHADEKVIQAVRNRGGSADDRKRAVIEWLQLYSVLMGWPSENRMAVAGQIIAFADEGCREPLRLDKHRIMDKFGKLAGRIQSTAPPTRIGGPRKITSLTSKALWCCYPEDIPIFDANAAKALGVISRICRLAPEEDESEHRVYADFLDVWLQVYRQIESAILPEDLTDCSYKIRVLDRVLWYLGNGGYYAKGD